MISNEDVEKIISEIKRDDHDRSVRLIREVRSNHACQKTDKIESIHENVASLLADVRESNRLSAEQGATLISAASRITALEKSRMAVWLAMIPVAVFIIGMVISEVDIRATTSAQLNAVSAQLERIADKQEKTFERGSDG